MRASRLITFGTFIAVLAMPLTAVAGHADPVSIVTAVSITDVTVTPKNDGSGGNAVSAAWTAPVASDGSNPLWYDLSLSTSATDPAPNGDLTNIGSTASTQASGLFDHFGASGTYYFWVTAHYDYTSRLTSAAEVAVQYTRPVIHDTDTWTPTDLSLHVAGGHAVAVRWRNYSNMPDVTIELTGPKGVSTIQRHMSPDAFTGQQLFGHLADGSYRARLRQVGVATQPESSDGSMVLDHVYEWSSWTKQIKVGVPSRVSRPRLRVKVPGRWIGNVEYIVELKRPAANSGYTPTYYEIQRRYDDGGKRWFRDDAIAWKWSRATAVTSKSRGYWMTDRYQVRVRACTSGDYAVYDKRMPVKVCGAYSHWSKTARLHAARASFTA